MEECVLRRRAGLGASGRAGHRRRPVPGAAGAAAALLLGLLGATCPASAQEMEPRAYSPSPTGANFYLVGMLRSTGDVVTDPSIPVTNVNARVNTATSGYMRTFGLAGRSASIGIVETYTSGGATGDVGGESQHVNRYGLGDTRLRFAVNLVGVPALPPAEFAKRKPTTSFGASLQVVAPTGQYDPSQLINVGTNRWAFKPELGVSQPLGRWFLEGAAGAWLFTDNTDFQNGQVRSQDPLYSFQIHAGYTFRPALWLAADGTYYRGGTTSIDGTDKQDLQSNKRYGLTFSAPIARGFALKFAAGRGLSVRTGGDFDVYALTLQYLHFDRRGHS
jgi:hypothetical protein